MDPHKIQVRDPLYGDIQTLDAQRGRGFVYLSFKDAEAFILSVHDLENAEGTGIKARISSEVGEERLRILLDKDITLRVRGE